MARGSFRDVARFAGTRVVYTKGKVHPKALIKKERYLGGPYKSPKLGASLTFFEFQPFDGRRVAFRMQTDIYHYELNETKLGWYSYEAGRTAAKEYLQQVGNKLLPSVPKYLFFTRVSTG
jgi:hypothetical protein